MVRTTTSPAMEDEQDLSKVSLQFPMFEALVRGYLSTAGGFLTRDEKQYLAFSGKLITFEIGIRFLTDYLAGDTYFKVHRDGHNLDRCRTQFKLVESIEQQEDRMERLVESITDVDGNWHYCGDSSSLGLYHGMSLLLKQAGRFRQQIREHAIGNPDGMLHFRLPFGLACRVYGFTGPPGCTDSQNEAAGYQQAWAKFRVIDSLMNAANLHGPIIGE